MPPARVLVIGVGSIGERHLRCFQRTGRAEVALVEIQDDLRRTVAARYQVDDAYPSLDAALAGPHPDAAVICTPAPLHVPQAIALAERGIHLLIEKPLSTALDDVDRLQETVRRAGIAAAVAYVLRVHPVLKALKAALDTGRFGRPVQLVAVGGQHFPTYRPAYRQIYYARRATGGGAIQDALTHVVNAGQWLLGPIDRLVVDAAHQVLDGVEVEDTVHLLARHGSALATYSLNQYQAPNESTITVVGSQGTVRAEFHEQRWRWMVEPGNAWHEEPLPPLERDDLFVAQAEHFLDYVAGRGPPACSLDDGLATLRVNLAALRSWNTGSWQTVQ